MKQQFSRIIQGCMTWGEWGKQLTKNEMVERMHRCMDAGITTFDHADIYGDYTTEIDFGKAFSESGIDREHIQLISKCGIQYVGNTRDNSIKHYQYDANYIVWSAEKSISDLQSDYLDLLLIHRPSPLMQPVEIAKAVDRLKSEGKIKAFGVSNFSPSQTALIQSETQVEANQIEFSITHFDAMHNGSLDDMMAQGITPMCWSPLGAVFRENNEQTQRIRKLLQTLSTTYNATEDQLLLAWIQKHPAGIHPVIGTTDPERISKAAETEMIGLSEIDWFQLLVVSQGHKVP